MPLRRAADGAWSRVEVPVRAWVQRRPYHRAAIESASRRLVAWTACALLLATNAVGAQEIDGRWQGTLDGSRIVLDISHEGDGRLTVARYNLDHGGWESPSVSHSASFLGAVLQASFDRGDFTGSVDARGRRLAGRWTAAGGTGNAPSQPLSFTRPTARTLWRDSVSHRVRMVTVEKDVRLEVLDFGGIGRPVVLLAGLGGNAHTFDAFGHKLTDRYHVYAITRRGFAPSSVPTTGYLSDSLADDVRAVLDSLHLERPVLVGHSIAGEELSSIGSRAPERVAGLVYLDAANVYAFYDPSVTDNAPYIIPDVQRRLALIFDRWAPISFAERAAMIRELADTTLPVLTRDLRLWADELADAPNATERRKGLRRDPVASAIFAGGQRYTKISGPVLALFVAPQALRPNAPTDSAARAKLDSMSLHYRLPQIEAFRRGVPQGKVVLLPHADHFIWRSHEADVLREMRAFIDALPR
jgi:non-heme chloroperoxidase